MKVLPLCALLAIAAVPLSAQTRSVISGQVDNSVRITIQHSTHPLVRVAIDQGRADSNLEMGRMILVLTAGPDLDRQLRTFLDSQQTIGSADYHRWLTPDEFGQRFGPSPDDVQRVETWLEQQGFAVSSIPRSGRWIEFSGTLRNVESAFQTQMHRYTLDGKSHIANGTDISVPAALAPVVVGVLSLNDFFKNQKPPRALGLQPDRPVSRSMDSDVTFTNSAGPFHALGPGDYAAIYNLAPLYKNNQNGSGVTIAIVAASNIRISDVETFRTIFGLPVNDPTIILNGPDPGFIFTDTNNDAQEATLDTEWSGAVAPNATVDLVASANTATTPGVDLSAAYIVDNNLSEILSESFEGCEENIGLRNMFYEGLWQQAAAQGISVFVSASDGGAAGCANFRETTGPAQGPSAIKAVNGIASTPFDTAVGGTEFNEDGNDSVFWSANPGPAFTTALGYIPEMVWNESCDPTVTPTCPGNEYSLFAGSGGASTLYPKPSWQSLSITGVPNDLMRDLPDISLTAAAHDGYVTCFSGQSSSACIFTRGNNGAVTSFANAGVFRGTSASAPSFAGIMAIVDQRTGGRQGLANYVLYQLAAGEKFGNCNSSNMTNPAIPSACIFNDITAGNNSVPGVTGYSATVGYDLASGLGSVNAANLVNAWSTVAGSFQGSETSLAASVNGSAVTSIAVQHGQPVAFVVNVRAISGNQIPTGTVAFVTSQYSAASFDQVASGSLSGGTFHGSVSSLPGGQYTVEAHYPGDEIFAASNSNSLAVIVTPENSSVNFSETTESGPYGSALGILATAAGASMNGTPTGQLRFSDGGNPIARLALNSAGQAELVSCGAGAQGVCLTVGAHTITASYSGDNSFGPSVTAAPVSVTIAKAVPTISLSTFPAPPTSSPSQLSINLGQSINLQAQVSNTGPQLPTGTVQFLDGTAAIGQSVQLGQVSPGTVPRAGIQTTLQIGTHTITAEYSGDGTYNSATSSVFTVTVTQPFQFSATNTSASVTAGQTATYSITLQGNNGFAGTVSLACSGTTNISCNVKPNTANLSAAVTSAALTVSVVSMQSATSARHEGVMLLGEAPLVLTTCLFLYLVLRTRRQVFSLVVLLVAIVALSGCSVKAKTATTTYTFSVTGTSGAATNSIPLTLTITQ